jgi:hypothetical protein
MFPEDLSLGAVKLQLISILLKLVIAEVTDLTSKASLFRISGKH